MIEFTMSGCTMRTVTQCSRLALIPLLALFAGCLYRMPVQQGNLLDEPQVAQLQTGMTRAQVLYLLGTPMVPDGFNNNRWDYYHYLNSGRGDQLTRRLTVWFSEEKVSRIEDSNAPRSAAGSETGTATPAPAAPAG
jgi:outer membrane protein assembly factor BamE